MKFFKSGFTLAEVLITLGVIGVVAAITVPLLTSNGKYQQLGARLAKFNSSLENAASEYVVAHDEFSSATDVLDFVQSSFIFKSSSDADQWSDSLGAKTSELKDGTRITGIYLGGAAPYGFSNEDNSGWTYFTVYFDPNVPGTNDQTYSFVVTERGYVFPQHSDDNVCLKAIYDNKWVAKPAFFRDGGVCHS